MYLFMLRLAKAMALIGGMVLFALVVLTCVSVAGRSLNTILHGDFMQANMPELANTLLSLGIGPITGDFELVEAGVAFAIFAFIPLCQITSGHATVEIFTDKLGSRANRWLRMVTEILFALVLVLIAWRLADGTWSKMGNGETTFLLQFPIWWAYALSLIAAIIAALVGIYMAAVKSAEAFRNRDLIPSGEEAEH